MGWNNMNKRQIKEAMQEVNDEEGECILDIGLAIMSSLYLIAFFIVGTGYGADPMTMFMSIPVGVIFGFLVWGVD